MYSTLNCIFNKKVKKHSENKLMRVRVCLLDENGQEEDLNKADFSHAPTNLVSSFFSV